MYSEVIKTIMSQMHILPRKLLPPMMSQKCAGSCNLYLATKAAKENSKMSADQRLCSAKNWPSFTGNHHRFCHQYYARQRQPGTQKSPKRHCRSFLIFRQHGLFSMVCTASRSTQNHLEATLANADLLTIFP